MSGGTIALHGGGEFQPGDEPFLAAILRRAADGAAAGPAGTPGASALLPVAIVPTAAARGRPELVGRHGTAAIERVAASLDLVVAIDVVPLLDRSGAADGDLVRRLAAARLIHLPGGDPDLLPAVLAGTPALAAMVEALRDGAVLAGASAGAMALAAWTWTPGGVMPGLGVLPEPALAVVPHADARSWPATAARFGRGLPPGVGLLGLGERTGVLVPGDGAGPWPVVGPGEARWQPAGASDAPPLIRRGGDRLDPRSA